MSKEVPAYTVAEAARYIRVAPATLRSWVVGRSYPKKNDTAYFQPLIRLPGRDLNLRHLSFLNMIEAHVLRGLRNQHDVPLKHVRIALEYAQTNLGIDRLLLHRELQTHAGEVFLEKYGQLLNLSRSGQIAMRKLLESHLKRLDWGEPQFPLRLYPFIGDPGADDKRLIVIDPSLHFGRPIVQHAGVSTAILIERIDNGEDINEVAEDYDLAVEEIEIAIVFERAA